MLLVLLFSLTLSQAFGDGSIYQINHYLDLEDFSIKVEAPDEVKFNEEFNVKLTIHFYAPIYVNFLIVHFGYFIIPFESFSQFYEETLLSKQNISGEFSKTYSFKTNSYGRISCGIEISYVRWKGTQYERSYAEILWLSLSGAFPETREELGSVYLNYTILKNEYEGLENNYEKLREDYSNLYENYNSLETDYKTIKINLEQEKEANEALLKSYNYEVEEYSKLFGVTTILFLTTIVILSSTIQIILKIRRKEQSTEKKGEGLVRR